MAQALPIDALLGPRITLAEWGDLPDSVPGELVEGRLVEEEMPDYVHEVLTMWLGRMLGNWGEGIGVIVGGSEAKFAISASSGRKPDLSVYFAGRRPSARGILRLPPDIAVEVVSPSPRDVRRDREEKMTEYAEFGIRFYWLVDPTERTLEIFERATDGKYARRLEARRGIVESIPGCTGLRLDLDAMWAQADALADE
jgi:Uma2 family endonuclease